MDVLDLVEVTLNPCVISLPGTLTKSCSPSSISKSTLIPGECCSSVCNTTIHEGQRLEWDRRHAPMRYPYVYINLYPTTTLHRTRVCCSSIQCIFPVNLNLLHVLMYFYKYSFKCINKKILGQMKNLLKRASERNIHLNILPQLKEYLWSFVIVLGTN